MILGLLTTIIALLVIVFLILIIIIARLRKEQYEINQRMSKIEQYVKLITFGVAKNNNSEILLNLRKYFQLNSIPWTTPTDEEAKITSRLIQVVENSEDI